MGIIGDPATIAAQQRGQTVADLRGGNGRDRRLSQDPGNGREGDVVELSAEGRQVLQDEPGVAAVVARQAASAGADFIPGVGNVKSAVEAWTGKDPVTGDKLAGWERGLAVLGIVPGLNALKAIKHGIRGSRKVQALTRLAKQSAGGTGHLTQKAKKSLAKRVADIPHSAEPVAQGGSKTQGRWWEYVDPKDPAGKKRLIVVEHKDGTVHVGRPKPQSRHHEGGPPKYYDDVVPGGADHVGE